MYPLVYLSIPETFDYTKKQIVMYVHNSERRAIAMTELDSYVDAATLAQSLGVSRSGLYQLRKRGLLPKGIQLGRSRRWAVKDIQSWLSQKGEN